MRPGRRPPLRRCPSCGGTHAAWSELAVCARCRRELTPDREAVTDVTRERRGAGPRKPKPGRIETPFYNEFPPGF